ncbi:hypothetical protein BpHYR1_013830 [Brachionus plicatilis]|uniref:Uncharacterized protein n=1 Tax=Brachionus plicatilis TaxID=10195 RepID=A0A3M7QSU7_BRAPC|nr:hypothetical protein BpHYR1_013830 [Brachionus plicatilis]
MDFNPTKSVSVIMKYCGVKRQRKFDINGVQLSNVDGFEYLGLPFSSNSIISETTDGMPIKQKIFPLYSNQNIELNDPEQ